MKKYIKSNSIPVELPEFNQAAIVDIDGLAKIIHRVFNCSLDTAYEYIERYGIEYFNQIGVVYIENQGFGYFKIHWGLK